MRPTEDPDKVITAIKNIFSNSIELEGNGREHGRARLETDQVQVLEKFKMILQRDRIRTAARSILSRSIGEDGLHFYLNKQAAYAGHISFSQEERESPLGPIHVHVATSNPFLVIDWLTGRVSEKSNSQN